MLHNSKYYFEGEAGVRYPVGAAVAYLVYVDPKASIMIEFNREKWEYRGEYSSSSRVVMELSDYGEKVDIYCR